MHAIVLSRKGRNQCRKKKTHSSAPLSSSTLGDKASQWERNNFTLALMTFYIGHIHNLKYKKFCSLFGPHDDRTYYVLDYNQFDFLPLHKWTDILGFMLRFFYCCVFCPNTFPPTNIQKIK